PLMSATWVWTRVIGQPGILADLSTLGNKRTNLAWKLLKQPNSFDTSHPWLSGRPHPYPSTVLVVAPLLAHLCFATFALSYLGSQASRWFCGEVFVVKKFLDTLSLGVSTRNST